MKRGVEARDGRHAGERGAHDVEHRQRGGLVQRRQVGERAQLLLDARVDHDRARELGAAVDDAVAGGVDGAEAGERAPHRRRVGATVFRRQVDARGDAVVGVEDAQLHAARPGVDDEDAHQRRVHVQSRISGASSPNCRV